MKEIKRARYLYFSLDDESTLDIEAFLSGDIRFRSYRQLKALAPLTSLECPLAEADFRFLSELPGDRWVPVDEVAQPIAADRLEELIRSGVVLGSGDAEDEAALRRKEEALDKNQWGSRAAFYHLMLQGEEKLGERQVIDIEALASSASEDALRFVEKHGPPPPAFHQVSSPSKQGIALPPAARTGPFYEALENRSTTRVFDTSQALGMEEFSTLLHYTFGCQGTHRLSEDVTLLHKSSASGGSLHPIEAYPLVLRVHGLTPGFYHFNLRTHSLEPVCLLDLEEVEAIASRIGRGQKFLATAQVLVIMTVRWLRNHWKYRKRPRTYSVIMMDAGHLSQTFYLVAARLGLGACYTAAIDAPKIEQLLGLETAEEGALGICSCGHLPAEGEGAGISFEPFTPKRTK